MDNRKMIYLDDAIDAIKAMPDCPNGFRDTYDKAWILSVLEEVPTGWIPVSEKLPEKTGWYIVTADGEPTFRWYSRAHGFEWYSEIPITAWMPLPEPYKGEEE